jgi:cytochrome c-type biogenesis protein CcmF
MAAEIGLFALILAFLVSNAQWGVLFLGAHRNDRTLIGLGTTAACVQAGLIGLAFMALIYGYLDLDFSVALVSQHSHSTQPLIYRAAAAWGSHEGSMLLWVLILATYGLGLALFGSSLRPAFRARVLAVQGLIGTAFLGFLLFTSNPFRRLDPAPLEGSELNPLLQDPGLIFHPPMLYLGYVGFSVAFAFAVAALIEGRVDVAWARWVRPWVLAAWVCLTIGITLGSRWAYYELGWGGWWFWDPVENASLMPWLMGTALLHSALVLERRGALVSWTVLLSILTFSLSLIGTFLVRSGVLSSVHAFAIDPERGVYILCLIAGSTGAALALFAWRAPMMRSGALFSPLSREGGITLNNLVLLAATVTVFLGTFYPVVMEVVGGDAISVGPPYYQTTFVPLAGILLALVSFGPLLNWKRDRLRLLFDKIKWVLAVAVLCLVILTVSFGPSKAAWSLGVTLGVLLITGAGTVLLRRLRNAPNSLEGHMRRWRSTPLDVWGMVLAHAGLGVAVIGMSVVAGWPTAKVLHMIPGQSTSLSSATVTLEDLNVAPGPNYQAVEGRFLVRSRSGLRELRASRRHYASSQTTEAGISTGLLGNTFITISDPEPGGGVTVRLWRHRFMAWVWAGGMIMALGGGLSLLHRGWRIGVARREQRPHSNTART